MTSEYLRPMAHTSLSILVLAAISTGLFVSVEGLKCYKCYSTLHHGLCGEDFKLTSSNTSFIVDNCDYCNKFHFKNTDEYIRNCTEETTSGFRFKFGCDEDKVSGTTVESCSCNDDLCNGSISGLKHVPATILLCLSVYFSVK